MTLAPSEQDSMVEEESMYQEELVPCLTPGTPSSSSSSECSTESAWELIQPSPQGQNELRKCSAPYKKRRQLDFQVNTEDCSTIKDVLVGTTRLVNYSSSSHGSSSCGIEEIKKESVEQQEELATTDGGTGEEDSVNRGTNGNTVEDCSAVGGENLKVLISGTDGGVVYAREEVIDGSTVVNYIGNDVYWSNEQDTAEQEALNLEIIEHLKSLNIQPKLEVEEGSRWNEVW